MKAMKQWRNLLASAVFAVGAVASNATFSQDWGALRERARDSIVFIETIRQQRDGTNREVFHSTGFIVSAAGHVLTVAHAVPRARQNETAEYRVAVRSRHGPKMKAHVITRDEDLDLALMLLPNAQQWKPLEVIPRSSTIPEDSRLFVLGFPLTSDLSSAEGLLSSHFGEGGKWQTTLPLNFGNSGGPVFDTGGRVVGIAAGGFDQAQAVTYVIPADYSRPIRSLVQATGMQHLRVISGGLFEKRTYGLSFPVAVTVDHQDAKSINEVFCAPAGFTVLSAHFRVTDQSGAGTSLAAPATLPSQPNCVRLNMFVAGEGVERRGDTIINYKGRGALSGELAVIMEQGLPK